MYKKYCSNNRLPELDNKRKRKHDRIIDKQNDTIEEDIDTSIDNVMRCIEETSRLLKSLE